MYSQPKNKYRSYATILICISIVILLLLLLISIRLISIRLDIEFCVPILVGFFSLVVPYYKDLIEKEDIRLAELKNTFEHLCAKNAAIDHHCEATTVYAARILADFGKNDISRKFSLGAKQVGNYLSYANAVTWMRKEADYMQRFTLVALLFKMVEEGLITIAGLYIYRVMDLSAADYNYFDGKRNELKALAEKQQVRQTMLIRQCEVAMGRLVGEMLRLNASNYQRRAFKAFKTISKLGKKKYTYAFYQKVMQYDTLGIDDAIESVSLGLKPKKGEMFVRLMFELAVDEDGIKNDEWRLLLQLLTRMKFDEQTQDDFVEHYQSLRTEFDSGFTLNSDEEVNLLEQYRKTLGVTEDATVKEIQEAYHRLAMMHHPDFPENAGRKEECERLMMKIIDAYNHLVKRTNKNDAD